MVDAIDWKAPIEAVHEDGRVEAVTPTTLPSQPGMAYAGRVGISKFGFAADGYPLSALCPWRIRNVATPQEAVNAVPQEVVERMVKLCERVTDIPWDLPVHAEARAIVAMLEPVDPDEAEAMVLAKEWGWYGGAAKDIALAAIKRGRALERGDVA